MSRNGKGRGKYTYKDLDESGDGSDVDGVALVMSDSDSSGGGGPTRKYVVSDEDDGKSSSICKPQKWSRNERICVLVGCLILIAVVILLVVILIVTQIPEAAPASGGGSGNGSSSGVIMPWDEVRLPANVTPSHYDVHLSVNLETFAVTGSVNITCSVNLVSTYILLHAKDMTIRKDAHVQSQDGGDLSAVQFKGMFEPQNDFYVIELSEKLEPGTIYIHLPFKYTLRDDLAGFYKSSYVNDLGEKRYLATTQFEPTDARRAFPCFDEPALKANFTMHITHNKQYHAVSNMPEMDSTDHQDGTRTTHFETSVKMSTYLVAFIVSDFVCVNDSITEGRVEPLQIRVCSSPVVSNKTSYALSKAKDIISFYESEFNVPYPLPKQDLFAIPDFAAGAMENWGLITYRETALLYDAETNPATSQQRVAVVIAHELAHQWFGNLVTMAWWDGLWLNEGFASFMEYIGTDNTEPSFNMLDQFYAEDLTIALDLDSLNESHPILQEVASPDEINSLFDTISYSKGASVIRMLKHYLGEATFKAGITYYLNTHKFGNAETAELWQALQAKVAPGNSGRPTVESLMDTWTKQKGYPVVSVIPSSGTTASLSQQRFLAVPPTTATPYSDDGFLWKVPFDYITCEGDRANVTLETKSMSLDLSARPSNCWIKANTDQSGFYRVQYDHENWLQLIRHLREDELNSERSVLTPVDRAGLLEDAFALSSAGLLDTHIALNMTQYLVRETNFLPWSIATKWFYTLGDRLSLTSLYGLYQTYVSDLLQPMVDVVMNFDPHSIKHLDIYLRSAVLGAAWRFGNEAVIQNATASFNDWKERNISVDPNLKTLVYKVGVAMGGEDEWNFVWNKYNETNDPYEKRLLLRSLAESTEPWILSRYLNYSVTKLRSQDTLSVIVYISRNIHGRYLAWNFIRNNWSYIAKMFSGGSFFDRFILYVTESFSTEFELEEVVSFFERNPDAGSGTRAYRQAIEGIRGNIRWLANNQDLLQNCLKNTRDCFS